ncbi:hypothetical protein [Streptomyces sp. NPDC048248]|uniref:hypothetical protein n=1 Tax=Streptomyces sp. NPDC048248 TaxID=3365523 RepID=UPI0037236D9C
MDINAFPGIRGQAGAPEALAELSLRAAAGSSLRGTGLQDRPRTAAVPRTSLPLISTSRPGSKSS